MLITPDLSEALETSGAIPDGIYKVRIENAELVPTKKDVTKNFLKWTVRIFGAEGEASKYNNWKVFHNTMTSGPGAGMLRDFYKAAMKQDLTSAFDPSDLYGKELQITLQTSGLRQDGTPNTWPEVKAVRPL